MGTGEGEGETRDGVVGGEMRTREKERGEGRAEFEGRDRGDERVFGEGKGREEIDGIENA